ncbi:hypothetical protein AAG906_003881 [Vitis piasezkii]
MDLPSHFLAIAGLILGLVFWYNHWRALVVSNHEALKNASLPTTRCGSYPCWKFSPPVALVTWSALAAIKKFLSLVGAFVVSDVIPFLEWVDLQGHLSSMKLVAKELDSLTSGRRT